jgi:hypothetical protein
MNKYSLLTILIMAAYSTLSYGQSLQSEHPKHDTVFANHSLPNSRLLKSTHQRFSMLLNDGHTYRSIKLLDVQLTLGDGRIIIVQKLYDGSTCNVDSVIVNSQTLAPIESYSNLPTARDSFIYSGNRISGAITPIEKNKNHTPKQTDTSFSHPMFNGLTYAETYQSLTYQMGVPFYLAQYVPGHNVNFERVEYIGDENILINGINVKAMVVEIKKTSSISIRCWLSPKTQELLKIEGKFPSFSYSLIRL